MTEIEREEIEWVKVVKGSKITKATAHYYIELSNYYFSLAKFSTDPKIEDNKKLKANPKRRRHDTARKIKIKR